MNQTLQDLFEDGIVAVIVVILAMFIKFIFDASVSVEWLPLNAKTFGATVIALLAVIGIGSLFMVSRANARMFSFSTICLMFGYGSVITDQVFLPGYYLDHAVVLFQGNAVGWEPFRYGMAVASIVGLMFGIGAIVNIAGRVSKATFAKTTLSQRRDKAERVNDSTFGEARWMTMDALQRNFTGKEGIILGEAYEPNLIGSVFDPSNRKSWGAGGSADVVRMPTTFATGHSLIFAGSNGYKSVGFVMPNALSFSGGLFVVDPKGEIAATAGPVREAAGRRVEIISAFEGLDPVDLLAPHWKGEGDTEIFTNVAEWIVGESTEDRNDASAFFNESCRNMLAGILAYYAYGGNSNVIGMAACLFGTDQKTVSKLIGEFADETSNSFVVRMLKPFKSMADATLSGIIATVNKSIGFANHARMAKFFDSSARIERLQKEKDAGEKDDKFGRLLENDVDIYLQIPLETITSHPQLVRVFLGAFAKRYMRVEHEGAVKTRRLLIVDEAGRLKRMSLLEVIRDTARSKGLHIMMIYQSLGQLYQHYGQEGARAWFDSAAALSFSCLTDIDNMKKVSELVGSYTASIRSTSTSKRGIVMTGAMSNDMTRGTSESLREVKLISTDEIRTMRDDEQILMLRGKNPVRCGKAIFFRRRGWDDLEVRPIRPTTDLPSGDGDAAQEQLDRIFNSHADGVMAAAAERSAETTATQAASEKDVGTSNENKTDDAVTSEDDCEPTGGNDEISAVLSTIGSARKVATPNQAQALNEALLASEKAVAIREIENGLTSDEGQEAGASIDQDQALGRTWDGR